MREEGDLHFMKNRYALIFLMFTILLSASCATKVTPPTSKQARVALVLGAGAAKGFAHIGVIKVLESQRIPVHMIVGTSAGSFVGSLYAYGFNAFQLQGFALALERDDVVDLTIPDNGFIKGEKLENYVNRALRDTPMEKLRIPFYAVTTNIETGEPVVFGRGNTGQAVRASCSVPGIFQPPKYGNKSYVDGGVVDPLAVDVARQYGADIVIAVDISGGIVGVVPQTTMDTILKSIDIMYNRIASAQLGRADVVIVPKVGHIAGSDLSRRHEAILEGEKAAMAVIPLLQQKLAAFQQ
jgi:NTE family protein